MLKKVVVLTLFLMLFLGGPHLALAENEFSTSYNVTYDFNTDGTADVVQKVSLKNLTNQYFASNFTLAIGSTDITDISATDDSGTMETRVDKKGGKTSINVKFNQQVTGQGKTQDFNLKFKSKDFTQIVGQTWEVNLPRIPDGANIESYNLTLATPLSIGDPTSISPNPKSQSQSFDKLYFSFAKEQLSRAGVSVNFGTTQVFNFSLKYDLENPSLLPALTSVSLPPDTLYQDVAVNEITPQPLNVTIDDDGNYLAWYRLSGRSKMEVSVKGLARLLINSKVKDPLLLTAGQIQEWTKSDKYWEKENPAITATLAEIFKGGVPKTNREKARLIYDFVVKTLKYDDARLSQAGAQRLGAVTALSNPDSAVCMEFTDLFVTLARAAGVPARELDGYAFSENRNLRPLSLSRDLLHAWAEYYDTEKGWVMVDPTWENTSGGADYFNKLDLNHVVFAVRGVSSVTPFTASDAKAVLKEGAFSGSPRETVEITVPPSIWAGFPTTLTVKVGNIGNALQPPATLTLNANRIKVLDPVVRHFGPVPPFGSITYKFNLRTPSLWESFRNVIEVEIAGQKFAREVEVKPFFFFLPLPYVFAFLSVLAAIIYLTVLMLHLYHHRKTQAR